MKSLYVMYLFLLFVLPAYYVYHIDSSVVIEHDFKSNNHKRISTLMNDSLPITTHHHHHHHQRRNSTDSIPNELLQSSTRINEQESINKNYCRKQSSSSRNVQQDINTSTDDCIGTTATSCIETSLEQISHRSDSRDLINEKDINASSMSNHS
jgi:hypothetical protein